MIDYMQLMDNPGPDSRQQQISEISRGIKAVARELNVPVMALSQLNRSSEGRDGHRPRMSDLRESGSIEQDADVIALLHREDYYRMSEPDFQPDNIAEVIIAKQRNGPTGTVKLTFLNKTTRFREPVDTARPVLGTSERTHGSADVGRSSPRPAHRPLADVVAAVEPTHQIGQGLTPRRPTRRCARARSELS